LLSGITKGISDYAYSQIPTPVAPGRVSTPQSSVTTPKNVTININKGNVTAKEIANAVNKGAKTTGSPSIQQIAIRRALK
jgi:hypothetical protein